MHMLPLPYLPLRPHPCPLQVHVHGSTATGERLCSESWVVVGGDGSPLRDAFAALVHPAPTSTS